MSKINEQIERLRELIRKCYATVAGKNGTVPEVGERTMSNLPAAIESVPSPVKVKVTSFTISNSCINEDGIWEGQRMIDTTFVTSLNGTFDYLSALKYFNGEGWDVSNVTNLTNTFSFDDNLEEVIVKNWNTSKVTTLEGTFRNSNKLITIDCSGWDTSKVTNFSLTFLHCPVRRLDLRSWDCSSAKKQSYFAFRFNNALTSIVNGLSVEEVVNNNVTALKNLKISIPLTASEAPLDRASLRAIINGLADLTGETTQTIQLSTNKSKLTEEDIAIATSKNWSIA